MTVPAGGDLPVDPRCPDCSSIAQRERATNAALLLAMVGLVAVAVCSYIWWPLYEKGVDAVVLLLASVVNGILFGKAVSTPYPPAALHAIPHPPNGNGTGTNGGGVPDPAAVPPAPTPDPAG